MRVNVYGEELTDRIEVINEGVVDPDGATHEFWGVRFWLKFPNQPWWIHRKVNGEPDDDSTAVTFWSDRPGQLEGLLEDALAQLRASQPEGGH